MREIEIEGVMEGRCIIKAKLVGVVTSAPSLQTTVDLLLMNAVFPRKRKHSGDCEEFFFHRYKTS